MERKESDKKSTAELALQALIRAGKKAREEDAEEAAKLNDKGKKKAS